MTLRLDLGLLPSQEHALGSYFFGFLNFSVMRSLSPIARYLSRSTSPLRRVGGSVQTPSGQSALSLGLALISDDASNLKPAASARRLTVDTLR